MGKNILPKKIYKSTSFTPSRKKSHVFREIDYQDLVVSTLKEKYQYFIVGLGVLFGLLSGTSYLMVKNTSHVVVADNRKTVTTKQVNLPTATLIPTKTMARTVTINATTLPLPTSKIEKNPKEVVVTPKVDHKKAAEAAKAKPNQNPSRYVVKKGDSLWRIAENIYKSGFNYKDLISYNKLRNPSDIEPGQVILIPPAVPKLPTRLDVLAQGGVGGPEIQGGTISDKAAMTRQVSDTSKEHIVVKGDTLWNIASRTFGDGFSWKDIAKANGISDPEKLEVGTKLVIPR